MIQRELQNNTETELFSIDDQSVRNIDYDCRERKLYWTDNNNNRGSIRSGNVDGSNARILFEGAIFVSQITLLKAEKYFKLEKL